jgi:hypothetical protein
VITRDENGRAQVAVPSVDADIATKGYVDAVVSDASNSPGSGPGNSSCNIPASTAGYLATHSGTEGTFGVPVDSSTWQKSLIPAGSATALSGSAYAITLLTGQTAAAGSTNTAGGAFGIFVSATAAATARTVMIRDASGRAKVVDPSVAQDIANKGYVDAAVANSNPFAFSSVCT